MSTNDQQLDENAKATLDETRDDEDNSENLDEFFSEEENDDEDAPVSREEYNRLIKGTKKLAAELGRLKNAPIKKEVIVAKGEEKNTDNVNPVLLNLYFKSNPEAEEIWDEVKKEASLLNKDPFELYEGSAYFKGEAKTRFEMKNTREANKEKIGRPSQGKSGTVSFAGMSSAEAMKLSDDDYIKWSEANQ